MVSVITPPRVVLICILCGNRWNPRYTSFNGCPYCRGTGEVIWQVSVADEARRRKARKVRLRREIEAAYEVRGDKLPVWNVFWAFVYHDAHARGDVKTDLAYCVAHGILNKKASMLHGEPAL